MRKVTVIEPVHPRPAVDSNEWADKLSPGDHARAVTIFVIFLIVGIFAFVWL